MIKKWLASDHHSMKKILKIIVVIMVAYACCLLAVGFIVSTGWFADQLQKRLNAMVGRKITFSSIRPSLFWGIGASVRDVRLYEKDGRSTILSADGLGVKVRIIPLFRRMVNLSAISLDRPDLRLVRDESGRWNVEGLFKKEEAEVGRPAEAVTPRRPARPGIIISDLRINRGVISASAPSWEDDLVLRDVRLRSLELSGDGIGYFKLTGKIFGGLASAEGRVSGLKNTPLYDVSIRGKNLSLEEMPIKENEDISISGACSLSAALSGRADNLKIEGELDLTVAEIRYREYLKKTKGTKARLIFSGSAGEGMVKWSDSVIELAQLNLGTSGSFALKGRRSLDAAFRQDQLDYTAVNRFIVPDCKIEGTGKLDAELAMDIDNIRDTLSSTGDLVLEDGKLEFPSLKSPVYLSMRADLEGRVLRMGIKTLKLGNSICEGTAGLQYGGEPVVEYDLHMPHLDFKDLSAHQKDGSPSIAFSTISIFPEAMAEQVESGAGYPYIIINFLRRLDGKGRILIAELIAGKIRAEDVEADTVYGQGAAQTEVKARLYNGEASGSLEANFSGERISWRLNGGVERVDLRSMLAEMYGYEGTVEGRLFADVKAGGEGNTWQEVRPDLSASGSFRVEGGKLRRFTVARDIGVLMHLLGTQAKAREIADAGALLKEAPVETNFTRLEGDFRLEGQKWGVGNLIAEFPYKDNPITMKLAGEMGEGGKLDFTGHLYFPRGSDFYNRLAPYFPDEGGMIKLPFPVPVGGTLNEPRVDMQAGRQAVMRAASEIAKLRLRKELEKGIDRVLAPKPGAEGKKPTVEDVGRELLKDATKELLKKTLE